MRRRAVLVVAGIVATLGATAPARSASAANFTVNTTADVSSNCTTTCSLRGAITEANRVSGADVITVPSGSYTLNSQTNGDLPINSDITITGASAATTTISGDGKNARIFRVFGASGKATISHLRLTFASVTSTADTVGGIVLVDSGATANLDHVRIDNGQAVRGGGIAIRGATANVTKSSIDNNHASQDGAGIINLGVAAAPAKLTLTDSTVASNTNGTASGVQSTGNTGNVVTVTRSTIAYNNAGSNGGTGLRNETGTISVAGSILVENRGDGTQDNCGGTITVVGTGNVENFNKCGFALHDVDNTKYALLAQLPVTTFETPVLPIPATSPAVNLAGTCTGADQRDLTRPQGLGCDAGAYEVDLPPDTKIDSGPNGLVNTNPVTFTFSSDDPDATFQCSLDGGAFTKCSSPQAYLNLAQGAHTFSVRALDQAGQPDPSPPANSFTVDTVAPNPPVIGGSNAVQNATTVTLTGSAEPGSTVTVLEGATTRGTATAPNGSWTVTINSVADGAHAYVARATDAANNTSGNSNTRTITVDTVAPTATIDAGPSGAINTSTITLTGTAEAGATVTVLEGATTRGTATATGGNWTVTINSVADGAHAYLARATDPAGNTSGNSNTRTITVDTTAPAAPVIGGANGTQNTSTVTLTGTAEAGAAVEVFEGATSRGTTVATGGNWTVTLANVADGTHAYVAKATDLAGNVSANSNTRTITVDTTAPAAPVIGGSNAIQNSSTVTLSGTAEAGATVTVFEGATSKGSATATGGNWTVTINTIADGAHSYVAKATDGVGNTSVNSNTRTITVDTTAPIAPVIGGVSGPQNTSTVTLSGNAEGNAVVEVFEGATSRGTTLAATDGTWVLSISNVPDGAHSYVARATDAAGNTSGNSNTRTITVDTAAPAAPVISGSNALQGSSTVTLSGTAEAGATVTVLEGATTRGTATATGGNWTVTLNSVADGAHSYVATARDAAGNVSGNSNTRTITVDTTAPAAPVIGGSNALQKTSTVTLTGTAEAGATVTVLEGATTRGTATATGGNWTVTINSVADGAHAYLARATDPAGNTSGNSNTRTITVDTTAPAAPVIGGSNATQGTGTVNLGGTAEAGSAVEVFEGAASRGTATATGGNWALTINNVPDGAHAYVARATDAAGNTSVNSNTRTITVDSGAPTAIIDAGPSGSIRTDPTFAFHSDDAGATLECRMNRQGESVNDFNGCTSPKTYGDLAEVEGTYTFEVRAVDAAGNTSPIASRTFVVDLTPPPADVTSGPSGPTTDSSPSFGFSSPDATTFDCKLDGPGATQGSYGPCTSPANFSGLQPGDYVFSVRATDGAGNQTVKTRSFTVTTVQQGPPPTVGPAQEPTPVPNQTVVIQPLSGKTLVKLPGSNTFEPVDITRGIPNGSTVDTKKGKIRLFAIPKAGKPAESALFYDGIFKLKLAGGVTELQLVEQLAKCPSGKASAAAKKKPKSRKLWGDGSGSFRTRGQYSAATVRGTKWLVQDSCGKTLTRVAKGVVEVQDFVKKKKVLVRAPKSYTARKR